MVEKNKTVVKKPTPKTILEAMAIAETEVPPSSPEISENDDNNKKKTKPKRNVWTKEEDDLVLKLVNFCLADPKNT